MVTIGLKQSPVPALFNYCIHSVTALRHFYYPNAPITKRSVESWSARQDGEGEVDDDASQSAAAVQ